MANAKALRARDAETRSRRVAIDAALARARSRRAVDAA
jgi:hypothetical protein